MPVKLGRKAIGIELKPSYFHQMVKNVKDAEDNKEQQELF